MATKRELHQKLLKAFGIMKAPTSEENAAEFNRMVEAANEHKAKRFAEERQIAPDFIDDDTIDYSVSDETHQYDSDEALRSKPAMKRVKERMKRQGRSEADIKDYTDALIAQDKFDQGQRTRGSLDQRYPGTGKFSSIQNFLKAFGIMKAESKRRKWGNLNARQEGTYLPTDYKSKKTVDDITEGSWGRSDYNPPPSRSAQRVGVRPHRTNVDDETYEDVEHQQERRDKRYQAGLPTGQKVGRRDSTRGHKGMTADVGPKQQFMDVGRTGAAPKESNRGVRTSEDAVKPGRRTQVVRSEAHRKKELAALSPEERKKSPFQRLKEADTKHLMAVEKLYKAFGVMKAERGEKKRQTYESRDNMLRIKRRQLNRGAPGYEGKTLADLDDHERKIQQALGNHDWEPPAHGETSQVTSRLNAMEADWNRKRIAAERIGDRSWSPIPPRTNRREE